MRTENIETKGKSISMYVLPIDVQEAAEDEDEVGGAVLQLVLGQELVELTAPTLGQGRGADPN